MTLSELFDHEDLLAAGLNPADRARLAAAFSTPARVPAGGVLVDQGEPMDGGAALEYVLLSGQMVSLICDAEGREVCTALHAAPCVITPAMARSAQGLSLVRLEAVAPCLVASMSAPGLIDLMVADPAIRDWANGVLRAELARKAGREWCLAALRAPERLSWFRRWHPDYEARFRHSHIASYLGVTPVTLSRARHAEQS